MNRSTFVSGGAKVLRRQVQFPRLVLLEKLIEFIKANTVMCIACAAALATTVVVPIDSAYAGYFDFKTLSCLFCVLAVVCALKNIRFFYSLAQKIVQCFRNARLSVLALVYITFIGSMLIANDMALLTFLPLGYFVLTSTGSKSIWPLPLSCRISPQTWAAC